MIRLMLSFLLAFILTSCRLPSLLPTSMTPGEGTGTASSRPAVTLKGRIERPSSVMATPTDIANGATIAVIDAESGLTLSTGLSDAQGNFVLSFGDGVTLVNGRAYYLDVMKGIRLDANQPDAPFNQAGADTLRLRNILFYEQPTMGTGAWKSLMNGTAGNEINVGNRSTTLSIALALKRQAGETVVLSDFAGSLEADIENDPAWTMGGLTQPVYTTLKGIVLEAIANDRDPLQYVVYDAGRKTFLNPWIGFSIASVTPTEGPINQVITITGEGFDLGDPTVAINGREAQVLTRTPQIITAKVLPGTRTGPVSVKIGTTLQAGNTFKVNFHDGHSALYDRTVLGQPVRMLYVANPTWNTIVEVAPDGAITKVWDDTSIPELKNPRQVAVWNGKLYVSCDPAGTVDDKILQLDPANPAAKVVYSTAVQHPYGLAFDLDGFLHISSYQSAGSVVKLNAAGAVVAQYNGLASPRGLAFDYLGNLFVAEEGGRVVKLKAPAMAAETWGLLPSPLGLAVDSAGDLFVASNTNDVIYRINSVRAMSVFAMLSKPGGLTIDERGYLYVSDTGQNLVRRISPSGDSKIYAYGISNPRGLAVDPDDGTLFVSLNASNAILKVENGVLKPFVTGIANPMSITFRGKGLLIAHPETHTISYAERNGKIRTLATGLEYPGGADQAADASGNLTGPLYAARFGDMESSYAARLPRYDSYDISNGAHNGVDVIGGASPGLRRWLYRQQLNYIAVDAAKNIYAIHSGDRTLTKIAVAPGGGNSSRKITRIAGPRSSHTFGGNPGWVALDAASNVYVVVPSENTIYRFKPSGATYTMDKITGFSGPWGIAFSDTAPQAMFVSNTTDGKIRRVLDAANDPAAQPTATFEIPTSTGIRGLAYMASGVAGTGTLYMANGTSIMKADLASNTYKAATYDSYFAGLPRSCSYLFAKSLTGEVFAWADSVFSYVVPPELPLVPYVFKDYSGWGRYRGFTFDPSFNTSTNRDTGYYAIEDQATGLSTFRAQTTTREVQLKPDPDPLKAGVLYVASPDSDGSGGILRIDLDTHEELMIPLRTFSIGLHGTDLYAGVADNFIYHVDAAGKHTSKWNLSTLPYGLDIRGSTVWAVGANSLIFERPIGAGVSRDHKFGMMGPVF
ncbi:Serine/threonine-protein kinase PknD [compost metagenome]